MKARKFTPGALMALPGFFFLISSLPALAQETGIAERATALLRSRCIECHGKEDLGGYGSILDYDRLYRPEVAVIERGSMRSLLLKRVDGGNRPADMPDDDSPRLTKTEPDGEVPLLRRWIALLGTIAPVSPEEQLKRAAADLEKQDARSRARYRYVTLMPLKNAGFTEETLKSLREKFAATLQTLSGKSAALAAVDQAGTLFRIDLASYGWSAEPWKKIERGYPYYLSPDNLDLKKLQRETTSASPLMRIDWLVENAQKNLSAR